MSKGKPGRVTDDPKTEYIGGRIQIRKKRSMVRIASREGVTLSLLLEEAIDMLIKARGKK